MPHASVKLKPGVDQNETPALNEAGISTSNLIRFIYDRAQGALIQKLGGWTKYYPNTTPAIVRALWAWEDTQAAIHLAYGTQTISTSAQLGVITNGVASDITPRYADDNVAAAVSATSGSSYFVVTDATTAGITGYDSVYITTQIAIGGVVLFGQYLCNPNGYIGGTTFTVQALDALGNPLAATSTTSTTALPLFSVTNASPTATVTLDNHGYLVGSTFPVLLSTTVGGTVFYGNYLVQTVVDANNFTIITTTLPTSTTTGYLNSNLAHYIYSYGVGAIPTGTGYGVGAYGSGGYGTGTAVIPSTGTAIPASDWTLDNWGAFLLACPIGPITPPFQPIYQWDSETGSPIASVIPNAPVVNDGMFVAMPQRQIIAWGSTFTGIQDPLLIRWCDVNNYDDWTGTVTNQAGSYRLPKGSKIVGCIQGPQQALVWTDLNVWSMQYIGQPYVYSFNEIGSGCGMIARKAAASFNGVVYWMGPSQFFSLTGTGVQPVACPIWDVIFQDLDQTQTSKIRVAVNSRFGEITWYYPTMSSGGEVTAYVKLNANLQTWDFGTLGRSAWVDQSVLGPPIGADPTSLYLYQHETSTNADGQAMNSSFQTGYYAMAEADVLTFVDQVWPDMKWGYYGGTQNATVDITFYVANYPGETPRTYGPYAVTESTKFITPRFRGRLVSINISSNDIGSFWRIGNMRYRLESDGKF
tara:strand:+ start:2483 stop:4573 length:2091 start_codon:yes stop_codon:yes gene_type:complete